MKKSYVVFSATADGKPTGGAQCTKENYDDAVSWASTRLSGNSGGPSHYVVMENTAFVMREPVPVTVCVIR